MKYQLDLSLNRSTVSAAHDAAPLLEDWIPGPVSIGFTVGADNPIKWAADWNMRTAVLDGVHHRHRRRNDCLCAIVEINRLTWVKRSIGLNSPTHFAQMKQITWNGSF